MRASLAPVKTVPTQVFAWPLYPGVYEINTRGERAAQVLPEVDALDGRCARLPIDDARTQHGLEVLHLMRWLLL